MPHDNELRAIFEDADAILNGRELLNTAVADLLTNPANPDAQTRLVNTINSPGVQAHNEAMARVTASLNEEATA
jgi:hypothetical protein